MKTHSLTISLLCSALVAGAAELHVGEGQEFAKPSKAAKAAQDGDTIVIHAGRYAHNVCAWTANNLVIRGEGADQVILDSEGRTYGEKGIWVISGTNVVVEGITFCGAACDSKNGSGIRLEPSATDFTVRSCIFRNNENGILCGPIPGTVTVEYCEFAYNGHGDGYSHNIYIGHVDKLVFRYNVSHHAKSGHDLKSRAKVSIVEGCRFDDGETGESSYLADFPNGGKVDVKNCVFVQSPLEGFNDGMVTFGLEGNLHPNSEFEFEDNVLVNKRKDGGRFITVRGIDKDAMDIDENRFTGPGEHIVCD